MVSPAIERSTGPVYVSDALMRRRRRPVASSGAPCGAGAAFLLCVDMFAPRLLSSLPTWSDYLRICCSAATHTGLLSGNAASSNDQAELRAQMWPNQLQDCHQWRVLCSASGLMSDNPERVSPTYLTAIRQPDLHFAFTHSSLKAGCLASAGGF